MRPLIGEQPLELRQLVEQQRSPELPYDPEGHFEDLQQSALYDKMTDLWNYSLRKGRTGTLEKIGYVDDNTFDQLAAVLVEQRFAPEKAVDHFLRLQRGRVQSNTKFWCSGNRSTRNLEIDNQLLAVLIESKINPNEAAKQIEALQNQNFFDKKTGYWLRMHESAIVETPKTKAQLLSLLVHKELTGQSVNSAYLELQQNGFYNQTNRLWLANQCPDPENAFGTKYMLADQLLALLIEAKIDPESARQQFERIEAIYWYWPAEKLWGWHAYQFPDGHWVLGQTPHPDIQLLFVLVEDELNRQLAKPDIDSTALPEVLRLGLRD